jgi:hypothetical protein
MPTPKASLYFRRFPVLSRSLGNDDHELMLQELDRLKKEHNERPDVAQFIKDRTTIDPSEPCYSINLFTSAIEGGAFSCALALIKKNNSKGFLYQGLSALNLDNNICLTAAILFYDEIIKYGLPELNSYGRKPAGKLSSFLKEASAIRKEFFKLNSSFLVRHPIEYKNIPSALGVAALLSQLAVKERACYAETGLGLHGVRWTLKAALKIYEGILKTCEQLIDDKTSPNKRDIKLYGLKCIHQVFKLFNEIPMSEKTTRGQIDISVKSIFVSKQFKSTCRKIESLPDPAPSFFEQLKASLWPSQAPKQEKETGTELKEKKRN